MPAFLTLDSLSAATGDGRTLFSDLSFSLGREVVGLVGRNGSGKSTLLSILMGECFSQSGHITRAGRVAMLCQAMADRGTIADALGISDALACLRRLEEGQGDAEDAAQADWELEDRLAEALALSGLAGLSLDSPVMVLSGGERVRLGIVRMLLGAPDVLLMDEPTNNLDVEGRAAIRDLLAGWKGGAIVASHDRELLAGVDRIVHLSPVDCTIFSGGWSAFEAARDALREQAQEYLVRAGQEARRASQAMQNEAERQARRDRGGRTKKAKGDEPRILMGLRKGQAEQTAGRLRHQGVRAMEEANERLAEAQRQVEIITPLHIDLPSSGLATGRQLLRLDEVTCERGGRRLFGPLSFTIAGPERLVLDGPNGSGKTSLLRIMLGEDAPSSGSIWRAEGALAMLDQHCALLDPALDLVAVMQARFPGMMAGEAHQRLARFAFRNRDALRPVATLSGGEKLRAGLALVTGGPVPPQLLILDEPTNHLDMEAVDLLEQALGGWDGALLIVSHDRRFLDRVGYDREISLS